MAKTSPAVTRIAVDTRIGRLVFRVRPNGSIVVRTKGQERIRIRERDGEFEADGKLFNRFGVETIVMGKTAEQCYKRAVKQFWA